MQGNVIITNKDIQKVIFKRKTAISDSYFKVDLVQGNFYRRTRLVTRSTRFSTRSTVSTRLPTRSTCLSTVLVCRLVVPIDPFVVLICPLVVSVFPLVVPVVLSVGLLMIDSTICA